jgi:hypothetical protein
MPISIRRKFAICAATLAGFLTISSAYAQLMDLRARVSFHRGKLVIQNENDRNWSNCNLYINPDDEDGFFGAHVDLLEARQAVALDRKQFTLPTGEIYNPKQSPPVIMRIVCDGPDGIGRSAVEAAIE